jgi:hypothetical protein
MPVSNEQVFIEFQTDLSQLETAADALERLGVIDKAVAEEFRKTNAQINAQQQALKNTTNGINPLKKGLEGLSDLSKRVGENFRTEFLNTLVVGLADAGFDVEKLDAKMEALKGNAAFDKLQDDLVATGLRITEIIAQMEELQSSGGSVEALDALAEQLKKDEALLDSFATQFKETLNIKVNPIDPVPDDKPQKKVESLRQELKNLTVQIAEAKVNGTAFGEEYGKLAKRAGEIKDALADANAEISRTGSDTRNVEGLLDLAGGVAGGFAVAQGTMALFGDESEELQKTLLKVNAVMAILQGLQQVQNLLQKESAASQLLNRIATLGNAAAQRIFGASIAGSNTALKAFRIALAATGIGAALLLIGLLVEYWDDLKEAVNGVSEAQKNIERDAGLNADAAAEQLEHMEGQEEVLKQQGKSEKEILKLKVDQINQIIAYREQQLQAQAENTRAQVDAARRNKEILAGILNFLTLPIKLISDMVNGIAEFLGSDFRIPDLGETLSSLVFDPDEVAAEGEKTIAETQKQIDALKNQRAGFENQLTEIAKAANEQRLKDAVSTAERQLLAAKAGSEQELAARKRLLIAQAEADKFGEKSAAKRKLIEAQLQKDLLEADAEFNRARADERIKALENQLLLAEAGSREELMLRLKLLDEQKKVELTNTELTAQQRINIEKDFNNQKQVLQREFNKKLSAEALEEEIARNSAALASQRLSAEDRLNLTIANIEAQAELEVQAANGNAAKIKEIYANRDLAIRNFKKQMIDDAVEYEISLAGANDGATKRALQRTLDNQKSTLAQRIAASRELTEFEVNEIDQRIAAEQEKAKQGLFKTEEERKAHNLRMAQLEDERLAKTEEQVQSETEMRKAETQKWIDFATQSLNEVLNIASSINDIRAQQEADHIQRERDALESAKASGSITEKEAIARAKRIDFEERRLKQKQAEREKQVALFQALINGASAVVKALASGGPIMAAIVGALAAVQIAIIASKPIPKFARGKKKYQSAGTVGEVGEAGAELMQREDGTMYLVKKRTITWVGDRDVIYSAAETSKMLGKDQHRVSKVTNNYGNNSSFSIDYRRMEKIFKKHSRGVNINIQKDFIEESVNNGFNKSRYFNNRYSFK